MNVGNLKDSFSPDIVFDVSLSENFEDPLPSCSLSDGGVCTSSAISSPSENYSSCWSIGG